jgi:hypothetical protein
LIELVHYLISTVKTTLAEQLNVCSIRLTVCRRWLKYSATPFLFAMGKIPRTLFLSQKAEKQQVSPQEIKT